MKIQRIGILLSLLCLSVSRPASAAEPRAYILGLPGLMPDEQADLRFNPAFVHDVAGGRLFTGLTAAYFRNGSGGSGGNASQRGTSLYASGEWVSRPAEDRWAVRYNPGTGRAVTNINGAVDTNTQRNLASGRVLYGRRLRKGLNGGLSLEMDDTANRGTASGLDQSAGRHAYTLGAGVISGVGTDRRLGAALTVTVLSDHLNGAAALEDGASKARWFHLRLTPERRLNAKTFLRGQAFLGHEETNYAPSAPSQDRKRRVDAYELGAAYLYRPREGTLWTFGAMAVGHALWDRYTGTVDTSVFQALHNGIVRIGVEQKFLSNNRLSLMGSINPLSIVYIQNRSGLDVGGSSNSSFAVTGAGGNYIAGLGFQATDRLLLELVLDDQFLTASRGKSNFGTFRSRSTNSSQTVTFSLTYRL